MARKEPASAGFGRLLPRGAHSSARPGAESRRLSPRGGDVLKGRASSAPAPTPGRAKPAFQEEAGSFLAKAGFFLAKGRSRLKPA